MDLSRIIPRLARVGSIAAGLLIIFTVSWVVLLVHPSPPPDHASAVERLAFIEQNSQWQIASFVVACLMAIAHIPVWAALASLIVPKRQTTGLIAAALGVLYGPVIVVGYWTQLTTVRSLNSLRETNTEAAIAVAAAFNFSGNFWTASYGIVIVGFAIWGLATLTICSGLIDSASRPARLTAGLFGLAGLLALFGAIGFAANVPLLEHGIILSGIVFVPALVAAIVLLHRVARGSNVHTSNDAPRASAEPVLQ
jgi:hypothetical protein